MKFKSFVEARAFAHDLKLKNYRQWLDYCKSGEKPADIPSCPYMAYIEEWKSAGDWLGTKYIAASKRKYRVFEEAKAFTHNGKFKSVREWNDFCKSGNKPDDIPSKPATIYKEEWQGYDDWIGRSDTTRPKKKYLSFEEAKAFVRGEKIRNVEEWRAYSNSKRGRRPANIPSNPNIIYKGMGWDGWYDWLGK